MTSSAGQLQLNGAGRQTGINRIKEWSTDSSEHLLGPSVRNKHGEAAIKFHAAKILEQPPR